jgi:UDP-N-acetylmuramate--alanine ligase
VVTYGLATPDATFIATDVVLGAFGGRATVHRNLRDTLVPLGELQLPIPGRHNLQNALAAIAVAEELGVDFATAAAALRTFQGAERRFERCGDVAGVTVIDDYGHHPTEISAVLAAARTMFDRRLVVVFQPHRYSRTAQLIGDFGPALTEADEIVLTDIYAAGEDPIEGVSVERLADAVRAGSRRPTRIARTLDDVVMELRTLARPGDVVLTLGAGSIGTLPSRLIEMLEQREERA